MLDACFVNLILLINNLIEYRIEGLAISRRLKWKPSPENCFFFEDSDKIRKNNTCVDHLSRINTHKNFIWANIWRLRPCHSVGPFVAMKEWSRESTAFNREKANTRSVCHMRWVVGGSSFSGSGNDPRGITQSLL